MSLPFLFACLWVIAASVVSFLPMRRQYMPGLALLVTAPLLIFWLGRTTNVWVVLAALAGFVSIFRKPLLHLAKTAIAKINARAEQKGE